MTVKYVYEAWDIVNAIFPTDYKKDEQSTKNSGYPVYRSTADGNNSWISDLGSRLEVNLDNGRTFIIWINSMTGQSNMKLRKYLVYVEEGDNLFKTAVPAKDEDDLREYIAGNGDVIAIKDVTDNFPISCGHVSDALREYGYSLNKINLIVRTLMKTGICDC